MAHRIKCKICNSCLSAIWVGTNRYYYCGFCHIYYGGRVGEINIVPSPYSIEPEHKQVEDPKEEE